METLVVVAQHRNQYSRRRVHGPARCGSFDSPPFRGFKDTNFQSATAGILPTPVKAPTGNKRACAYAQKTPSKQFNEVVKTSAIPIPISFTGDANNEGLVSNENSYSELWAGPAYSYSPPPSSLPIPNFSVRPKRTVSLNLPARSVSDIDLCAVAKSAPPSPTREVSKSSSRDLFHSADSATKTLRRILNLDVADD